MRLFILSAITALLGVFNANAQSLLSLDPARGYVGEQISVVVSGDNTSFSQSTGTINKVWMNNGVYNISASSTPTVMSDEQMEVEFDLPNNASYDGLYTVYYQKLDTTNSTGDTLRLQDGFRIDSIPNLDVSIIGEDSACGSTTLSADKDYTSYLWTSGETTKSIVVNTSGQGTLIVTDQWGRKDTAYHSFVALPIPTVDLGPDQTISDSVLLDAGSGFASYLWNDGSTSSTNMVSEGSHWVEVTNNSGCKSRDSVEIREASIHHIDPNSAYQGTSNLNVSVTGINTNFSQSTGTINKAWLNNGSDIIDLTSISIISSTVFDAIISAIPVDAIVGAWDMNYVSLDSNNTPTSDTLTLVNGFEILAAGSFESFITGDTVGCDLVELSAEDGHKAYLWSNGDTTKETTLTVSGDYNVIVTDEFDNKDTIHVYVTVHTTPIVDLGPDMVISNDSVMISVNGSYDSILWSNGSTDSSIYVPAGTYSVVVKNNSECEATDAITITQASLTSISPEMAYQGDQNLNVEVTGSNTKFSQSTGTINKAWLNNGSNIIDLSSIEIISETLFEAIIDAIPSDAIVGLWNVNYVALDSTNTPITDTLVLVNGFTIESSDTFSVEIYGDTVACGFIELTTDQGHVDYIWSNGTAGHTTTVDSSGQYHVIVTDGNNNIDTAYITVTVNPIPSVDLGDDIESGDAVWLSVNDSYETVLWSTGDNDTSIYVTESGLYAVEVSNEHSCYGRDTIKVDIEKLISMSPDSAYQGEALPVTLTGQGTKFTQSTGTINKVWLNNGSTSIDITNLEVDSETEISGDLDIPSNADTGYYHVYYYSTDSSGTTIDDTLTLSNGFKVAYNVSTMVQLKSNNPVQVYPNPASDFIYINNLQGKDVKLIKVLNIAGQTVYSSSEQLEKINVKSLESGIYLIVIHTKSSKDEFRININH